MTRSESAAASSQPSRSAPSATGAISPKARSGSAIADEVGREVAYVPVVSDGARRAAERIAEML